MKTGTVKVIYRDQEWELPRRMSAREAMQQLGLDREAVLVLKNGELVTDDTLLEEGDEVKFIAAISGGS